MYGDRGGEQDDRPPRRPGLQVEQQQGGQPGQDPLGQPGRAEQPPAGGHGEGGHRQRRDRASSNAQDGPWTSSPSPLGLQHEGERDQERRQGVLRSVIIMVLYASPPVMAAAATADSAVGGLTSDSTA